MAFLSHAGYRMSAVYGRQFHKLLAYMAQHYLPALEAKAEKDASEWTVCCEALQLVGGVVTALFQQLCGAVLGFV